MLNTTYKSKQFARAYGHLPYYTQKFLLNTTQVHQSIMDFRWSLPTECSIGYVISHVSVKSDNHIFTFDKPYGNYLYIKHTNICILNPFSVKNLTFSSASPAFTWNSTKSLQIWRTPSQHYRVVVEDDYDFTAHIFTNLHSLQQCVYYHVRHICQFYKAIEFNMYQFKVDEVLLELLIRLASTGEAVVLDEDSPELSDLNQMVGIIYDVSNHSTRTYLSRWRVLEKMLFQVLLRGKHLPFELVKQIGTEVVHMELATLDLAQTVHRAYNDMEWDLVCRRLAPLHSNQLVDLRQLLLLAGDVELNPGPTVLTILSFRFSLYLYFLIFFLIILNFYIQFNLFTFILFSLFLYLSYSFLNLIVEYIVSDFIPASKDHVAYMWDLVKKFYSIPDRQQDPFFESINKRYNRRWFIPILLWLIFWACVPLSAYARFLNAYSPVQIPAWLLEIFIPVVVLLVPGVDILNPNFYIMCRPDKMNFLLDVTIPYFLAYLYFFACEISWTSMQYLNCLYIGYMGAVIFQLIVVLLCKQNKKWYCGTFFLNFAILTFPHHKSNVVYLVWTCLLSFIVHFQIYFQLHKRSSNTRHASFRCWLDDFVPIFLRQLKFVVWALSWFLVYFYLSLACSYLFRYWCRVLALIQLAAMLLYLVIYFLPDIPDGELDFEFECSYEPETDILIGELVYNPNKEVKQEMFNRSLYYSSYQEMDRGAKLLGGANRVEHDAMDSEFLLISDFESVSEFTTSPPSMYYCPNFELFLKTAERQMEQQDNLYTKIKQLKQELADLNDREDALGKNGRSSFKTVCNKVSGKVLQTTYIVKQWLKSKRYKAKPVWMTLASVPKIKYVAVKKKAERLSHLLPKKQFVMETLGNSIEKAKEVWNITEHKNRFLRPSGKACKQEPLLDELAKEWKTQGANSFKYNSEEYIKSSISRYFEKPTRLGGTDVEALKEAAEALVHHNPKLYQGAELWSPEKILKKTVLKYSCQFPLTNNPNWRKKNDVVKSLGKPEVLRTIADYIRGGHYFRSLHTVFLKLAVVNRPKIEANPGKQRTITAQDWLNYSLGMFVCGSVNKRFDFDSNSAPFTPILTGGLVRLATRLMKHKYFAAMDFTAADSYFSSLIDGVIHVRKLGYRSCQDFDYIANVLEAYYEGLETSVIINREQGRKYYKLRGFSTGHANTTPDNTIAEQLAMLMAWHELTKRPFHEYYIYNDQPAYGDDNILGSSYYDLKTWNATNISQYITNKLGIPCRVEWEGNSLNGATFLAKRFCTDERVLQELIDLNIKTPVAIIQDEEKLRQNFVVNLKNPNPTYIWNYCIGYLLQTASLPHVYKDISDYLDNYLVQNNVSQELIRSLEKKAKRPTYQQVMLMTYANKNQRKLGWVDHTPILPSKIIDVYKAGVGHIAGNLQIFENLTRTLRQFIPDAPEDHTKPLMIKHAMAHIDPQQFLLEAFIYYKAEAPDYAFFKELCATSPYSTMLQPEIFCENLDIILPHISIAEALTIPHVMSLVFYGINSSARLWWNPLSWVQYMNKWVSKFYLEMNYFWWTCTGRSSMTLSKMVPKDPAYYEKRIAYYIARRVRRFLPNIMIDFKPYSLDAVASEYVMTVPDAPRKFHPNWDEAMPRIAEMLKQYKHITLKARTASGKTFFLPQMLKEYFPYITILTVNNVLVKSNSTPGFAKVLHNKRMTQDSTYRIMTYGLWEALQMRPRTGEIVLLDEFAERDESLYYAVRTINTYSIAMSATPKVEGLPDRPFIEVVVPRTHQIYSHEVKDFEEAIQICQELNLERWLFIIPNIEKVKSFARQLCKTGLPATAVYSGQSIIPSTGHIVATTLVDSGVDIGDLDAVIDSGKSVKQINGQLRVVDSNISVIEQRQGRVGRRKDGHYFKLSNTTPNDDHSKECSFFNAVFKPSVANLFGITSPSHIDIAEPLPPMFLCDDLAKQNTMNLAYLALKTHRKFADAASFYYKTLSNVEVKGNEYLIGRYEFHACLFDKVLQVLDNSNHRFTTGVENELLFNGKKFHSVKVRYSRVSTSDAEVSFVSKLTPGIVERYEEIETMEEVFASRFSPLSGEESSINATVQLLEEDEKAYIRQLFNL